MLPSRPGGRDSGHQKKKKDASFKQEESKDICRIFHHMMIKEWNHLQDIHEI